MKKTRRTGQVGDVIRAALSSVLQRDFANPDIGLVTVTGVDLSTDLRFAKVFVSVLGTPEQQDEAMEFLNRAKNKIRHALAQQTKLRYTPELDFRADHTAEHAIEIEEILKKVQPAAPEAAAEDQDNDN
ncbi:MAG TPA: 30S ribosome-binding factor RbfA [Thermoanaerobaculia bacterium]|nr:30S ribosome-binding factor RbfA [Thermoanaerobaculia bacterium]